MGCHNDSVNAYSEQIALLGHGPTPSALLHSRTVQAREALTGPWPGWVHPEVREVFERTGVSSPWLHQVQAADLAHRGEHTIIATGTASGKSLAYQLPALNAIHTSSLENQASLVPQDGTVLYLAPTKALAADQLSAIAGFGLSSVRAASYDGDTEVSARRWIRDHANFILSNPDMLHFGILPNHTWWARVLRRLRFVIIDEAHSYRGVFGSNIANLLRRLRRICEHYGANPVFIGASATSADPAASFSKLIGATAQEVTTDFSPKGALTIALWEPPLTDLHGENGAPTRRTVVAETSNLLANLVCSHVRTLAFIKSRRGAETIATITRKHGRPGPPLAARSRRGIPLRLPAGRAARTRGAIAQRDASGRGLNLGT